MKRSKTHALSCEALEERSLLSGFGVVSRVPAALHASQANVGATGSVAGLNVGPAPTAAEYQAVNQVASSNNLALFLSQLALLSDGRANIQVGSQAVLNDARDLDLRINDVTSTQGVAVTSDLSDADEATARQVVATVHKAGFESAYLSALVQTETRLAVGMRGLSTGAQNSGLAALGQSTLALVQGDLATARAMQTGGPLTTATNLRTTPSSTTLSSADLQTLEQAYSATALEHFLAQLTDLQTGDNTPVDRYAEKLLSDHEMEDVQLGRYAAATGTFLPANPVGTDAQTALRLLSYVNRTNYVPNYLTTMVSTHTTDIQNNQKTIATTTNPVLKEYAMDDIPTDWLHRAGAQHLLSH